MLSDLIIASRNEAQDILTGRVGDPRWRRTDVKGMDYIKVAQLAKILFGAKQCDEYMPTLLAQAEGGEGPWVFLISSQVVNAIAAIDGSQTSAIGAKWAREEEWVLDRCSAEQVGGYLRLLCESARAATQQGLDLLMWLSL